MNPTVTIYITNYNYGKYIAQSIESVLGQTYKAIDLIIIDDGSTDNSHEIIHTYAGLENVRTVFQKNKGLNATNNVAIELAQGKYIMRLDADDFLEPSAVAIMVALLEADDSLGLVFPDYYYVDAQGNVTGQERRHHFDDEVTLYDQPAHGACTMVRLDFLKALGGYDESFSCQDGYELWIKFTAFHKVTNISRPLFSYRRHGNNLTTNEKRILDTRKEIKRKFVEKHLLTPKTLAIIPVRSLILKGQNWALTKLSEKTVIEHKVETCLNAMSVNHVVITTSEPHLFEVFELMFMSNNRVSVIKRPEELAKPTVTLSHTVDYVLNSLDIHFDAIITAAIEYPFVEPSTVDEVVHSLVLFKADSVITVKAELNTFYRHNGKSFKPILDHDKHTKYEREALYKGVGGLVVSTSENFKSNRTMISNRVAHVLVDDKHAFGVFNEFDYELLKSYLN